MKDCRLLISYAAFFLPPPRPAIVLSSNLSSLPRFSYSVTHLASPLVIDPVLPSLHPPLTMLSNSLQVLSDSPNHLPSSPYGGGTVKADSHYLGSPC